MANDHLFKTGNPGGPGRKKGSRSIAMEIIFDEFNKHGRKKFREEMKKLVQLNPVAYYIKFILPIQPKEFQLTGKDGGAIVLSITKNDEAL